MARYNNVGAVVLGLELNGLSVARSLGRHRVQVTGIDNDFEQTSSLTRYLVARIPTQDIRGPSVIDTLEKLAIGGRKYALFPTMDATVLCLSENRDRIPENIIHRLPSKDCVHSLLHKGRFRELLKTSDLDSPGYALAQTKEQFEDALESLRYPLVVKRPLKEIGPGAKATKVENREEALETYIDLGSGEFILEEWIPGGDGDVYFCLQAYGADSDLLASFVGRKIRQWPPRVGGTASAEPIDLPELEEMTTRFFQSVSYQGLGSMEYKRDPRDGRFYAIEPTVGRTDFQSGIAPANGVNIPLAAFCEMARVPFRVKKRCRSVKWFDLEGDARSAEYYIEQGELTHHQWKKSLSGPRVGTLFAFDDPGPWVSGLFRRIVRRLKRTKHR